MNKNAHVSFCARVQKYCGSKTSKSSENTKKCGFRLGLALTIISRFDPVQQWLLARIRSLPLRRRVASARCTFSLPRMIRITQFPTSSTATTPVVQQHSPIISPHHHQHNYQSHQTFILRRLLFVLFIHFSLDPFATKEWYDVKAPAAFPSKQLCKTVVTKTRGTRKFPSSISSLSPYP
jgi:hypothetical protein